MERRVGAATVDTGRGSIGGGGGSTTSTHTKQPSLTIKSAPTYMIFLERS